MPSQFVILDSRAIVRVQGSDARSFLQGLISQDMARVGPDKAVYGAFLTPQGKYLHDFCIVELGDAILLDCEGTRADDLVTRLNRYRLRADVTVSVDPDLAVAAVFDTAEADDAEADPGMAQPLDSGILFADPRHPGLGYRAILDRSSAAETLTRAGFTPGMFETYDALRVSLTVPDGSRDLTVEKTILLEANFDTLNGIDWDKGCFLGQELTARTRYRGLVKRRLVTVAIDGPPPPAGTPIERSGKQVGVLHSVAGNKGIASLRTEALEPDPADMLRAGDQEIRVV